jgi:hypothetical protein
MQPLSSMYASCSFCISTLVVLFRYRLLDSTPIENVSPESELKRSCNNLELGLQSKNKLLGSNHIWWHSTKKNDRFIGTGRFIPVQVARATFLPVCKLVR